MNEKWIHEAFKNHIKANFDVIVMAGDIFEARHWFKIMANVYRHKNASSEQLVVLFENEKRMKFMSFKNHPETLHGVRANTVVIYEYEDMHHLSMNQRQRFLESIHLINNRNIPHGKNYQQPQN